jgi:O-antigen ligase
MTVMAGVSGSRLSSKSIAADEAETRSVALRIVYFAWILFLFEPEWFLAGALGLTPLKRLAFLMFPILTLIVVSTPGRPRVYWPMAMFLALHTVMLPFVPNRGMAMAPWKLLLQVFVLYAASLVTINSVRRAMPVVTMYLLHFAWWALHGLPGGRVGWHYALSNEDGYGPLMGIGLGFASFMAIGHHSQRTKRIAALIAGLCGIGVVASFARGAFLAAALVVFVLWLRSPRKVAMGGTIVLLGLTATIAAGVLFPNGAYWAEMKTILDGYNDQTGSDRRILWEAGWRVFLEKPLVGVGAANFGVYASETFHLGEAEGHYAYPEHLWGRSLHNIYYQLLSEQGIVGSAIFLWLLIDFVRKNRAMRRSDVLARWSHMTDNGYDVRAVALGLEAALVAFLANGYFYDQLYTGHLYALIGMNLILWSVACGDALAVRQHQTLEGTLADGSVQPQSV